MLKRIKNIGFFPSLIQAGICQGESYEFNGATYTTAGDYNTTLIDQYGCDSLVVLKLQVTESIEINLVENICEGETYQVGDNIYNTSGHYTNAFIAEGGCDSLVHLNLTVFEHIETNLEETICEGETYQVGNSVYTQSGNYTNVLTSYENCDSTVHLNLTVSPHLSSTLDTLICEGEVFEYLNVAYDETTSFTTVLNSESGL